ncbi:hypothetical protein Pyn_25980 [Prunus yedoensis var. nudiflora]|uniref:Uncharacterized protein n=1 Tax=Prunus yedoensis var. nudiflora TaxID=2094558 RepID=A0A314XT52_PRUYE|nr:hypothetical protein Pyn_25980 [Prunus yedoensis var. nudiflora]
MLSGFLAFLDFFDTCSSSSCVVSFAFWVVLRIQNSEFRQLQFIIKQFGFRVTIELLLKFFLCGVICWWGFCQEFNSPSSHARFSRSLLFLNLAIGSE